MFRTRSDRGTDSTRREARHRATTRRTAAGGRLSASLRAHPCRAACPDASSRGAYACHGREVAGANYATPRSRRSIRPAACGHGACRRRRLLTNRDDPVRHYRTRAHAGRHPLATAPGHAYASPSPSHDGLPASSSSRQPRPASRVPSPPDWPTAYRPRRGTRVCPAIRYRARSTTVNAQSGAHADGCTHRPRPRRCCDRSRDCSARASRTPSRGWQLDDRDGQAALPGHTGHAPPSGA
ncbi:hypothetical protein TMEC50S_00653 [Thauera mechernichensis]